MASDEAIEWKCKAEVKRIEEASIQYQVLVLCFNDIDVPWADGHAFQTRHVIPDLCSPEDLVERLEGFAKFIRDEAKRMAEQRGDA